MLDFGRFFFLPESLSGGVAGCEEDADAWLECQGVMFVSLARDDMVDQSEAA